jgi:hypothetical protein
MFTRSAGEWFAEAQTPYRALPPVLESRREIYFS